MSSPTLDHDDINVLIEALEAWEHKDAAAEVMSGFVSAMLPHADERLAKMKRERESATRIRKERSVFLKAKLLTMRDGIEAEEFSRAATQSSPSHSPRASS